MYKNLLISYNKIFDASAVFFRNFAFAMAKISKKIDMLNGPLGWPMFLFALPLIAGGILQQSFNSADVIVIGRYSNSAALAAVGGNGPVVSILVNLFIGLSVGVNVVIARYIGQRNGEGVRRAVRAMAQLALAGGIVLFIVAMTATRPILELLGTPEEVLEPASQYLRIYAVGMPFMVVYNFGAAVLRSVGDTRRPFYSLLVAGIVNVGLNFLFVAGMGMDVAGVGWATTISNIVNATIITIILIREKGDIQLHLGQSLSSRPCWQQMGKIAAIGVPAGLQGVVFAISNLFILSAINTFGAAATAGSGVALNFEMYCYFVINAFGQTAVAFTGQNYGAGNYARCRRVFGYALGMCYVCTLLLNVSVALGRYGIAGIFTTDPEVIHFAAERILWVLLFQNIACVYEIAGASMRGLGYSLTPTLIIIFGTCLLRLVWVGTFHSIGSLFRNLMLVYPASWTLTSIVMFITWLLVTRHVFRKAPPTD